MATTVFAALPALVAAVRRALPDLANRGRVFDGRYAGEDPGADMVLIGWSPGELAVQRTGTPEFSGKSKETYDVVCLACALGGDTDPEVVRRRVEGFVNAIDAELGRDRTMGGVVTHARLSFTNLSQEQTPAGADVSVQFAIHVTAFA